MKKILFVLLGAFCLAFYGCKTDKTKTENVKKGRVIAKKTDAQVKTEMDALLAEMDATWNEMILSDDQKIDNLQTLFARIGRDKNFDQKELSDVIAARDGLKKQRYSKEEIGDVAAVDAYDSLQIRIMEKAYDLAANNNLTLRDTVAASLVKQIQEDDSRVPIARGRYDKAAKNYNQYLKDYQPQLQQLGPPYADLKPVPLFLDQPLQ